MFELNSRFVPHTPTVSRQLSVQMFRKFSSKNNNSSVFDESIIEFGQIASINYTEFIEMEERNKKITFNKFKTYKPD